MSDLIRPSHLALTLIPIWDEMVGQVRSRIGSSGLEALCLQIHRMRDAQGRIDAEGLIVADAKGAPAPHPAIPIERAAQVEVRAWIVKFGAAPSQGP